MQLAGHAGNQDMTTISRCKWRAMKKVCERDLRDSCCRMFLRDTDLVGLPHPADVALGLADNSVLQVVDANARIDGAIDQRQGSAPVSRQLDIKIASLQTTQGRKRVS